MEKNTTPEQNYGEVAARHGYTHFGSHDKSVAKSSFIEGCDYVHDTEVVALQAEVESLRKYKIESDIRWTDLQDEMAEGGMKFDDEVIKNARLQREVESLKAENENREAKLKEMFRLTGLHPKVENWANKIQELELIIYGLEEGSGQWEQRARDAESLNAELVEALKLMINLAQYGVAPCANNSRPEERQRHEDDLMAQIEQAKATLKLTK